ncbi:hypothetical protein IMSHALPRED_000389 [Imshaugia aleurites]|uniref:Ankyrin n=1 Tax=Imshaugia aleurites TaxID=172621 RepID=A0A8H3F1J5_9LECA|nr:hypothetical protein IMSHALPRED_000389 [Imshaugia aleurites]
MFAMDTLRYYGMWHRTLRNSPLTGYTIHKTLATTSSNDSLPSTISRVVNILLQNTGQQDSYVLRRAYITTLCETAVAHMYPTEIFAATEPSFQIPEDGVRGWGKGRTDHVVLAAICLNIRPVVDAYLTTHANSQPSSYYFGFALAAAVSQGHLSMTERLLAHGLTYMGYNINHPLKCAARAGHEQLVHLLSSRNIQWRREAIYGAAQGGHLALLTSLLESPEIFEDDLMEIIRELLLCGAEYGHLNVLELGLRIGKVGHISANLKNPDITIVDLQNGAQIDNWALYKSLAEAVRGGFTTIVQMLLDLGLDINKDCTGRKEAPLEVAAEAGRAESVRSLLDRGASIEGDLGLRAVTAAAKRGWLGVVDMLCDEGIVVAGTEANWLASNPILTAMKYDQAHIIDFFLQKDVASIDRSSIDPCSGELKSNMCDIISV